MLLNHWESKKRLTVEFIQMAKFYFAVALIALNCLFSFFVIIYSISMIYECKKEFFTYVTVKSKFQTRKNVTRGCAIANTQPKIKKIAKRQASAPILFDCV